jgi:D-alanyl-D-alanine-carboxypeptidase/D-alanyl-D-alanine-endopeptidase
MRRMIEYVLIQFPMRFKRQAVLRVILLTSLAVSCCSTVLGQHAQQVNALANPLIESKSIVGCVVGILDNGKTEIHAYGEVRHGAGNKPNGDTLYEIGSMTKVFTGTLLGDAVRRGKLTLEAPLQDFLPADVKLRTIKDHPIRLVDLASQSSGLPRMPDNFAPKDPANPYADYGPDQLMEFFRKYQLEQPPGKYEYSNLGVGLLGYILAKRVGKPYEQIVVDTICNPLKMADTRIKLSDEQRKRLAPPYNGDLGEAKNWDFDALAGAGALRSTANDMLKFAAASLSTDDRAVVKGIHTAWSPHYGKPGEIRIGLCWQLARDGETWWHNGQTAGYSSAIFVYPPKKLAVVVLCNTASEHATPLAEKTLQSILGMKPSAVAVRKTVVVDPDVLKSYEGTYALGLLFAITITVEDGKLMAQVTGQEKCQVYPSSDSDFFYKIVDAQLTFEKGGDGRISKLVLHQNGQDHPAIKIPGDAGKSP